MTIKTIIELQAKSGKRDDLVKAVDNVLASMKEAKGFLGMTRYEVIDNDDSLIEIAEWESAETRQTWLEQSMVTGSLNNLMGKLGVPFKAITVREMD
ncbi:MAG TPA: antibiotic biosynthesis monooxygenase family protein [Anaerolineales bacterium]|nr:antibiotic biosynthesis monooxygenase family protein [Anaerolineales bacterium]